MISFIGPEVEIALGDVVLRVGEQHLAAVVDHAADVVDMAVRKHHGVDVFGLDAGLRHALLLAAGGAAEILRRAHAGVEQHELVARVHNRRILLEHDAGRRQEIVAEHLAHLVVRHAGEGALGIAEPQRAVGDDRDFRVADVETIEILRLRPEFRRASQGQVAHHGRGAETCPKRKQGPSRNI
jgi:hypothetical protein